MSGWGNYPKARVKLLSPSFYNELPRLLKKSLIARGLGRSYADQSLNDGGYVLNLNPLNRFLKFDEINGILKAEAGVSLKEILEVFLPKGWFPYVTPGTKYVTLGGMIASDVHGKNHHREGSVSEHVISLTLLTPKGDFLHLTPKDDLYWATVGGMGLTGIVTEVELKLRRVETSYILYRAFRVANIDAMLDVFSKYDPHHTYSVAWIDCLAGGKNLGRGVVMFGEHAPLEALPKKLKRNPLFFKKGPQLKFPFYAPSFLLNDLTMRLFNWAYYLTHPTYEGLVDYERFFYPLDSIESWNRAYGQRGFIQFQFVIPSAEDMKLILEKIVKHGGGSFLAVLKRMGKQRGYLPFGIPGWTLALDFPIKSGLFDFLKPLMREIVDRGGRFYLTKDALMDEGLFKASYPGFPRWYELRRSVDQDGILSSDLAKRLGMA
ncbi:MAG: FAD-binding oxidoreductase [Thermotogae bacterium]|nr:FAD-binding oxidoreductase [Thermotogota bacterium]